MSIFRTIAMFIYLFGYMIVHYGVLRRAERALAAGDMQLVEELVNKHIPHWSRGILKVTGVSLSVASSKQDVSSGNSTNTYKCSCHSCPQPSQESVPVCLSKLICGLLQSGHTG